MSRSVQPLGTYGSIAVRKLGAKYAATTRYRDMDGDYLRIQATANSQTKATNALKAKIAEQVDTAGDSDLDRDTSPATSRATGWMRFELPGGRRRRRSMPTSAAWKVAVLPALGQLRLRELTVGRVDRFLKALAPQHPSRARRATIVLALVFDLAARHDAVGKNPVRDTARIPRGRKEIRSLHRPRRRATRSRFEGGHRDVLRAAHEAGEPGHRRDPRTTSSRRRVVAQPR